MRCGAQMSRNVLRSALSTIEFESVHADTGVKMQKEEFEVVYESKIGPITVVTKEEAVTHILFGGVSRFKHPESSHLHETVIKQLEEYFAGERKIFDLPLRPQGTPFQQKVWAALQQIPYGETRSYGEIAKMAGNEKACRAVGMANNRNPISIVIPCHRVIGADGSLTGYGGGLSLKKILLELEQTNSGTKNPK